MSDHPSYINPDTVGEPLGPYSQLSRAGDLIFVAGQVGLRADGELAGADLEGQVRQTFSNIRAVLESQGAELRDVLKFTTYLLGEEYIEPFYAVRRTIFPDLFPGGEYPPNTLLVVSRLVSPDFLVEIEAVAKAPARAAA